MLKHASHLSKSISTCEMPKSAAINLPVSLLVHISFEVLEGLKLLMQNCKLLLKILCCVRQSLQDHFCPLGGP